MSNILNNTTSLQAILNTINELPEAGKGNDPFASTPLFTYTVSDISGAQYGFVKNSDGYYESQNKGQNSSYAICRVNLTVTSPCDIVFDVINYAESSYDYALFGNLDSALTLSNTADSSVKKSFKGQQSASVVNVTYSGVTVGNHYIDIKFIKDTSQHSNNDSVQFKLRELIGGLSQDTIDKILAADSDLVASNIKVGVDIFGVIGTYRANTDGFPNGTAWTISNLTSGGFNFVINRNGIWVICSSSTSNGLYYSIDGKTWTQSNITSGYFYSADNANGMWIAAGSDGLYYSTDGKIWTQGYTDGNGFRYIVNAVDKWVVSNSKGQLYYSIDGSNWTKCSGVNLGDSNQNNHSIHYANGIWVACGRYSMIYSTDGKTWTKWSNTDSSSTGFYFQSVNYANGIWVVNTMLSGIWWSTDGKTWNKSNITSNLYGYNKPVYANGIWNVACDADDNIGVYYSTDGKTWTAGKTGSCRGLEYANSVWALSDDPSGAYYSIDGKTWTKSSSFFTRGGYCFSYADGIWVYCAQAGVYYSVTWEP